MACEFFDGGGNRVLGHHTILGYIAAEWYRLEFTDKASLPSSRSPRAGTSVFRVDDWAYPSRTRFSPAAPEIPTNVRAGNVFPIEFLSRTSRPAYRGGRGLQWLALPRRPRSDLAHAMAGREIRVGLFIRDFRYRALDSDLNIDGRCQ